MDKHNTNSNSDKFSWIQRTFTHCAMHCEARLQFFSQCVLCN